MRRGRDGVGAPLVSFSFLKRRPRSLLPQMSRRIFRLCTLTHFDLYCRPLSDTFRERRENVQTRPELWCCRRSSRNLVQSALTIDVVINAETPLCSGQTSRVRCSLWNRAHCREHDGHRKLPRRKIAFYFPPWASRLSFEGFCPENSCFHNLQRVDGRVRDPGRRWRAVFCPSKRAPPVARDLPAHRRTSWLLSTGRSRLAAHGRIYILRVGLHDPDGRLFRWK